MRCSCGLSPYLFQSTHPRGVRHWYDEVLILVELFQSTHPRGVRQGFDHICAPFFDVSIHAPARGATLYRPVRPPASCRFNPRTREGCDSLLLYWRVRLCRFQSTHPRGVRRFQPNQVYGNRKFQSTHPRGVRRYYCGVGKTPRAFQSTHPRGVRPINFLCGCNSKGVSIHAPARGATWGQMIIGEHQLVSIHAPARGATLYPTLS